MLHYKLPGLSLLPIPNRTGSINLRIFYITQPKLVNYQLLAHLIVDHTMGQHYGCEYSWAIGNMAAIALAQARATS